jgi:hypothetical protein
MSVIAIHVQFEWTAWSQRKQPASNSGFLGSSYRLECLFLLVWAAQRIAGLPTIGDALKMRA